MNNQRDIELSWKQYSLHVDLHKAYLELLLKFNVFFYAVTGALVSFYLSNSNRPMLRFSLVLPIVISIGFTLVALRAAQAMRYVEREVSVIASELGFETAPDVSFLSFLLRMSAAFFLTTCVGLLTLLVWRI